VALDNDNAVSVSSTAFNMSLLILYTVNNVSVHTYESTLSSLLEQLDGV
jgi:hypothetical protein